jgi:hypothetical protein
MSSEIQGGVAGDWQNNGGNWGEKVRPDTKTPTASSPEVRVAEKLFDALKAYLGKLAPRGVEIASHSADHVLVNLTYSPENFEAGSQALNAKWMMLGISLAGINSRTSFMAQGGERNLVQASMSIPLDKLERALDVRGRSGFTLGG